VRPNLSPNPNPNPNPNPDPNPKRQDIYTLILSLNLLVSTARLLWMFNFDPTLGPLQLMMARMVKDVFRFLVLFVVAFAGFVLAIFQMWCVRLVLAYSLRHPVYGCPLVYKSGPEIRAVWLDLSPL